MSRPCYRCVSDTPRLRGAALISLTLRPVTSPSGRASLKYSGRFAAAALRKSWVPRPLADDLPSPREPVERLGSMSDGWLQQCSSRELRLYHVPTDARQDMQLSRHLEGRRALVDVLHARMRVHGGGVAFPSRCGLHSDPPASAACKPTFGSGSAPCRADRSVAWHRAAAYEGWGDVGR